jgi:glycine/D-amino acid oxidase-like deaminating enzyme
MIYPDRGVTLSQHSNGNISALSAGRADLATARIGGCVAGQRHLRPAGQTTFRSVSTVDGAPLVGQAKGIKAMVVAGLGVGGVYFAPAIARLMAGVASESERHYFTAHEGGRGTARATVAEYQSAVASEGPF